MSPTVYNAADNAEINLAELTGANVIVTVPAAFSPTCTSQCVPGVIEGSSKLKEAGVDQIIVVASDEPFAINEWVKAEGWSDAGITFASDFGSFQLREVVGKLSDEDGKLDVPQVIGNLLRRGYLIVKDGEITWQKVEPDSTQFTVTIEEIVDQL